ncbi:MAG: cobyric acid synthase [bacterium]
MKKKIMFLGTGSDVGKSVTAAAFCRILKKKGHKVAPFKAQNMSNNSFVTIEGGEIGRAQATQAEAAGVAPSVHMNPVLLKPDSETGSQVVLQGKVYGKKTARQYYALKPEIGKVIRESYRELEKSSEVIVLEGAGSCCEVNLREHDLVNFEMALSVGAPVILVADIDKGGVFAQLVGSLEVISREEQDLVKGFIINKFRGDPALFDSGIEYLEKRTGKPVLGLVPYSADIKIDPEDSLAIDCRIKPTRADKINVGVIGFPRVSNFTDLSVLEREPEIILNWLTGPGDASAYDLLILPGSKSTAADLAWLRQSGWAEIIKKFAASGGRIIGLCGGFQMLGREISDPDKIEGETGKIAGLGLLDIVTVIENDKVVKHSSGRDLVFGAKVCGYEIHMGRTERVGELDHFLELGEEREGAVGSRGNVWGTYLHGLFDSGSFRGQLIKRLSEKKGIFFNQEINRPDAWSEKENNFNILADHFSEHVDVDRVWAIIEGGS